MPRMSQLFDKPTAKPAPKSAKPKPTSLRLSPEEDTELRATAYEVGVSLADLLRWRNAYAAKTVTIEELRTYLAPSPNRTLRMP